MLPHPIRNFEIQKYHQNEAKFNGIYSRNSWPKTKGVEYVIYLDVLKSVETHWIALYVNGNTIFFDSFRVEQIPKELKKFLENKNIITNIYRM